MPAYYVSKADCPCCKRRFDGFRVGSGQPGQPFILRIYPNVEPNNLIPFWIAKIQDPELLLQDQWLRPIDKEQFLNDLMANRDLPLTARYHEHEAILKSDEGYLYSKIDLHLWD